MDGNTIVRNLEVEEKVKIRPLMDGNLHGAVHSLKKLQVKIRPLMDGNQLIFGLHLLQPLC